MDSMQLAGCDWNYKNRNSSVLYCQYEPRCSEAKTPSPTHLYPHLIPGPHRYMHLPAASELISPFPYGKAHYGGSAFERSLLPGIDAQQRTLPAAAGGLI